MISTDLIEFALTFDPQMGEVFFARRNPYPENEIYTVKKVIGRWSEALAFFVSTTGQEFEPQMNRRELSLFRKYKTIIGF